MMLDAAMDPSTVPPLSVCLKARGTALGVAKQGLLVLAALLASGCGQLAPRPAGDSLVTLGAAEPRTLADCRRWFERLDAAVAARQASDAQSFPVPGFRYLRVNRTLSAMRSRDAASDAFARQMNTLRRLDLTARRYELANAAPSQAAALTSQVARCGRRLLDHDLADEQRRSALEAALAVPDSYNGLARTLGAYPLTALGFLAGIERLHRDFDQTFATPLAQLPVHGELVRFAPSRPSQRLSAEALAQHLTPALRDPFHLPPADDPDLIALFAQHAPIFEVDVVSDDDRIGAPTLDATGNARINTAAPTVYWRLSHVFVNGVPHAQLNYLVWFPARTVTGAFDLLGGPLDGLIWRVTLDHRGQALIYDSVHQCGCYHLFVPAAAAEPRAPRARFEEPVFVAQRAPEGGARIVLRIAHRTHYLERVYRQSAAARVTHRAYRFEIDDRLRSLRLPGSGRRSLFRDDGLVAGSERPERWLFWPMGVPSAGAMRQWGHHAVAFVGRRHFDDPDLMDRHFEFVDTASRSVR